jgi:CheY-like chemotaxis protein
MARDGSETILIAEDQESIRVLIRAFLEQRGYTLLAAQDGLEAISLLNDYPQSIDLLVTDVLLPRIDGGGCQAFARTPTNYSGALYHRFW